MSTTVAAAPPRTCAPAGVRPLTVHHDAQRLVPGVGARGELRVVGEDRADTDDDRVDLRAAGARRRGPAPR